MPRRIFPSAVTQERQAVVCNIVLGPTQHRKRHCLTLMKITGLYPTATAVAETITNLNDATMDMAGWITRLRDARKYHFYGSLVVETHL